MTIDEAIEFCDEKSKNIKLKAEPQVFIQIAEWLEELKNYQNQHNAMCEHHKVKTIEDIYNKAIDDFAERILEEDVIDIFSTVQIRYEQLEEYVKELAEQLKEGSADNEL